MRRPIRIGVRTRLLLAVVGAVSVALVVGVTAFNLLLDQRLTDSATSLAKGQAAAALSTVDVVAGKVVTPAKPRTETRPGSPVWVFSGTTAVESPRVDPALSSVAQSLADGPERTVRVNEEIRLYALPVIDSGHRVGTVVSGVLLAPYDETATFAFVGSVGLAVLLLIAVTLLTRWILGKAFEPVSRMTNDAAAWSDHDLDKRFDLGEPFDELTRLAATLDTLLERLSASLRHEQRLTAELSHELRTPLARIGAETDLALRRERTVEDYRSSLEAVRRNAELMTRTVEALVSAARQESGLTRATTDVRDAVGAVSALVEEDAEKAGVDVKLVVPATPVAVAIEQELVERIVQPLLDNAIRYGKATVTVELVATSTTAVINVDDDGSGVEGDECDRIFEPGTRGAAAPLAPGGAGLGLALARRLARSAGGEIVASPSPSGGHFSIRLPRA